MPSRTLKQAKTQQIGLLTGPFVFLLTISFFHPEGLTLEANAILASTLWIAIWWITEAIPIPVTSLLPIVLFPLTGGLDLATTTAAFGHRLVFLYVGGFVLAIAIERWNLHKRIALNIINIIGTNMATIILGFMVATAFLSMWISNTATAVMMLPIGMAIIAQLKTNKEDAAIKSDFFGKALMLAIAYSASIGGVATLIGTPPNLVLAGVVKETYGIEISFAQWMRFGLPISVVLLFLCWRYLVGIAFPMKNQSFPGGRQVIKEKIQQLGKISYEEKAIAFVFSLTALAWIIRKPIKDKIVPLLADDNILKTMLSNLDDTIIAIFSAIVLFLIPSKAKKGEKLIDWESAVKLPWGILLLFGGGLALAKGFEISGLAAWIGSQMTLLQGIALVLVLIILVAAVNFLTEITSNLATTSMILPILAPMALVIGVHPYALMVGATVAASCAFMLPVATPPNAIVFGSGYLRIPDMVRVGVWLNILSIIIVTLAVYFLLPLVWGIDLGIYPEGFGE